MPTPPPLRRLAARVRLPRRPGPRRLTCILGDLDLGGVPRVYLDALAALSATGIAGRIIAPDGPMQAEAAARGIAWEPVDWQDSRLVSAQRVASLLEPGEPTLLVGDPRSSHVLGVAASNGPIACAMHTIPELMDAWVGRREMQQLLDLIAGLQRTGRLRTLTIGETYRVAYERRLGPDTGPVAVLPPAIEGAACPILDAPPPLDSVLCLTRLSPEKRALVGAAVELVAARIADGLPCRLDVVGDGVWRAEAEALCARSLPPDGYRFLGATDRPLEAIRRAGVTVATGLTVLEAAVTGSRVVYARTVLDDRGPLGPALTPARFSEAAADAFGGRVLRPVPPAEVWRDLEQIDRAELAALRNRVLTEHSPAAAARALRDLFAGMGPVRPSPTLRAAAEQAAFLADELAAVRRIADEIWATRVDLETEVARHRAAHGSD